MSFELVVPDFSEILGCSSNDSFTHLGMLFKHITACGKPMGRTFLSRSVTVDCPECDAEVVYRQMHPESRKVEFGILTYKKSK